MSLFNNMSDIDPPVPYSWSPSGPSGSVKDVTSATPTYRGIDVSERAIEQSKLRKEEKDRQARKDKITYNQSVGEHGKILGTLSYAAKKGDDWANSTEPGGGYETAGKALEFASMSAMPLFEGVGLLKKPITTAAKSVYNSGARSIATSKESGLLSRAHELNPYAFKPNPESYYRVMPDSGAKDLINSGFVRPAQGSPTSYFNKGVPLDIRRAKTFGTDTREAYHGYKGPYMVESNNPKAFDPWLQFPEPSLKFYQTKAPIPSSDIKLYKEHWLKGYKEVSKGHAQGGQVNNNKKKNDMGSLYYMAGGWHSKNKYATGGTTLPYQMAPEYPEYEYPEYEQQGFDYDTTKKVGQAGFAVTKASGYNPYVALAAGVATAGTFVYNIFKSKKENEDIFNRNQGVGEQVKETIANNSAYNQDGGYNQINAAKGGPIWYMLTKDPENFQMNQNNNQFKRGGAIYAQGGGVDDNQDYGIITGNGSPTADDKKMLVGPGDFIVPAKKIDELKPILEHLGYNPNKTINPNNSFATGEGEIDINVSSQEGFLSKPIADKVAGVVGGPKKMEEKFSPNSPHNIYAAMGGKMGNNYYLGGPPSFTDEIEGFVSPADQAQAALDATRAAEAARIANNEPVPVVPIKLPPPPAAAVVPPASQKTMEQLVDENDAIAKTDEMTEEARRQNKTMLGINTAKAAGMGIWNALQKNPEMPKQGRFNPMLISSNTSAIGAKQNYDSAKAAATARYAATEGNINQTVSNASIHANTLAQDIDNAAKLNAIEQQTEQANVGTLNQASLYNLQADNQYNQMAAERTATFKQNKATAMSGNINDAAKGYNNYVNANLGINALEKGYNSGKINQALYQKAMNDPKSLTPEEIIQLNSISGGHFNPANLS